MERFHSPIDDPLALVSNASNQKYPTQSSESPQFSNQPSHVDNCQMDTGSTSTDNLIESLTNTLALLRTSSYARTSYSQEDRVVFGNVGGQNRVETESLSANHYVAHTAKENGHIARKVHTTAPQDSDYFKDKMLLMNAHENGVVLDETGCVFLSGEQFTNFDEDGGLFWHSMWTIFQSTMEAGSPYDSNTPFEVQDHDTFVDHMDEYHEVHEMQSDVQHNNVVDSDADYTSDSKYSYDQYEGRPRRCPKKKAETLAPKPISALTVYPPNTPVKLVPRILPTKSQVKINLYVLTQLFTEFDKTCKTRITPSGLTEGERGFEQTKRCYLTEVIPFFKTLKEHFVGVQTALVKEVKVMEEIFDQMNNEVDKNTVDKQCAEIEKKNLLIENENLIVNCLSTQLLARVHTSEKTSTMLNEIESLKAQLRSKEPCFTSDYVKPKVLAPGMYAIDLNPSLHPLKNNRGAHLNYVKHLKESVETVREIVEEARVVKPLDSSLNYACQYTKLSQELSENQKGKLSDNSLNKTKQIWKPKGKLSDYSLNKTKQVWKATGKLFANVGYQWRSQEKSPLPELNCGYQWRPTEEICLSELCPFTKLFWQ
ncbi:hypothetical protein Tco_0020400 [Tanacetum coccineum]|uniref:Uncharacterized protein n=1 Tax=Tanacetum coccineum TaxID=301880 RepID=A0ABQ5HVR9_9ASTR